MCFLNFIKKTMSKYKSFNLFIFFLIQKANTKLLRSIKEKKHEI